MPCRTRSVAELERDRHRIARDAPRRAHIDLGLRDHAHESGDAISSLDPREARGRYGEQLDRNDLTVDVEEIRPFCQALVRAGLVEPNASVDARRDAERGGV